MKIYLYDETTGIYQGEDFLDTAEIAGVCELPENATTLEPPPAAPGLVAVFSRESNRWELKERTAI
jgi:hypothetical protein